ncbi:hypothetical protein DRQ21_01640 [Candidatus Fermentibacteria bacterium]|nr:MAG: hypothetical protein DRQ21_01640 [Candidatus Fermentibacteria bacterium]
MKTVFLFSVLFCILAVRASGSEPVFLWNVDFPCCGNSVVRDAAEDSSGGFVVVGDVCSGTMGQNALSVCGIDSAGSVIWENTALNLGSASGYSIEKSGEGFVLCGVCTDSCGGNGLVMKVSESDGSTMWIRSVGYDGDDGLYDLCVGRNNETVAVGYSIDEETQDSDVFAVCVSDSGNVLWIKRFVAAGQQAAYSVVPSTDRDGGFILTGADNGEVFLMKIDNQGNWLWKTSYPLEGNQIGRSLTPYSNEGYIVAGSTSGADGYPDVLLVFFDENGSVVRNYTRDTEGPDSACFIQEVSPAGFVVLLNSNSGTGEGYHPYLLRFDPWLSIIWSVKIVDRGAFCYSLLQTSDGGFLVTGKSSSTEEDSEYSSCVVRLSPEDLLNWEDETVPVSPSGY